MELISKKTRSRLQEFFVGWKLREIEEEFESADIELKEDYDPKCSGQRRRLVEQYYASLDFSKHDDVRKFLKVFENVLTHCENYAHGEFNDLLIWLKKDGYVYEDGKIKPSAEAVTLKRGYSIATEFDSKHMGNLIKRIEGAVETDPDLALGSSKELVESCCKMILEKRNIQINKNADLPELVKTTMKELNLVPESIPDQAKGNDTIKRLLSNLSTVTQGMAELRNLYGTGHGRDGKFKGLKPRHARLAAGAATTLAVFLFDTYMENSGG